MNKPVTSVKKGEMPFWAKMLAGMAAGVIAGFILSGHGLGLASPATVATVTDWVMLPALVFLALITMIVIPLVFCSILLAVTEGGSVDFLKTVGLRVALYFIATTFIAVGIGYTLSGIINPAAYVPQSWLQQVTQGVPLSSIAEMAPETPLPQLIAGLIPRNVATAVVEQQMLQIVIAALLGGLALISIPAVRAKPLIDLAKSGQDVCMKIVEWAMHVAPVAVFGFLFRLTVETGPEMLQALSVYVATVLLGLGCLLAFYLTLVAVLGRRSPAQFLRDIRDAQVLAFSSSSSAATMPLTLDVAENRLKLRPEVSRLVIPLGTTINMDGTAMYQMVVALFLTQILGIDLTMGETILMMVTIVGASIGSPGTPGVGLVILATVLANVGVPAEAIGVILGVDRFLDMCRTVINVTGDLTAATVMNKLVKAPKG